MFIFECTPEDLTLKKEIFKRKHMHRKDQCMDSSCDSLTEIAQHANEGAILATNTMRINVEKIFENIECKDVRTLESVTCY